MYTPLPMSMNWRWKLMINGLLISNLSKDRDSVHGDFPRGFAAARTRGSPFPGFGDDHFPVQGTYWGGFLHPIVLLPSCFILYSIHALYTVIVIHSLIYCNVVAYEPACRSRHHCRRRCWHRHICRFWSKVDTVNIYMNRRWNYIRVESTISFWASNELTVPSSTVRAL